MITKSILRRYHWLVLGLIFVCLIVVANEMELVDLLPKAKLNGLTQEFSDRIELGMTEQEVTEALGHPPGDYATAVWGLEKLPRQPGASYHKIWASDSGVIWVDFDEEEKVTYVLFQKPTLFREPFLRR